MKKTLVFLFALFYLSVSTGTTVQLTYCMGKLMNTTIFFKISNKKRHHCEQINSNGCCKEESRPFKLSSDQNTVEQNPVILQQHPVAISVIEGTQLKLVGIIG